MPVKSKGFTLVELLVTLAIAAIVLGLAIPNFKSLIVSNRSASLGNEFAAALNFARSKAASLPGRVSICASDNSTACQGAWKDGFIVFVDTAGTDTASSPEVGEILKVWPKPEYGVEISVKRGSTDVTFVRYTNTGGLARITNDALVATTKLTNCTGDTARKIDVTLAGQITITKINC